MIEGMKKEQCNLHGSAFPYHPWKERLCHRLVWVEFANCCNQFVQCKRYARGSFRVNGQAMRSLPHLLDKGHGHGMCHKLISNTPIWSPQTSPGKGFFRGVFVDDQEHSMSVMMSGCLCYFVAELLKLMLFGLPGRTLLLTLQCLVSTSVIPGSEEDCKPFWV